MGSDEASVEVWSGCANPWECDAMGHLNVRFYMAKAMEGLAGAAALLGMPRAFSPQTQATLVVREHHIRFLREARPGAGLYMTAGVLETGESDARLLLVLRHLSGEPAATFQTMVAHVTAGEGRAFPWSARAREAGLAFGIAAPDYALPRSLGLEPVEPRASLERAEALGLIRSGHGVVGPQEVDAFGRMRAEVFIGRVADGMPRVLAGTGMAAPETSGRRIGGAVLEYRLVYLAWPRCGDRIALRSGLAGCDRRTRRMVHWLLDPETGRPYAVGEAVAACLDLETRKLVELSPEALAAVQAAVTPGLTL